jgi:queuine tRNA-ribosyltransferase
MNYDGPILTDSGGFQVFSLQSQRKISEDGVEFRNDLNGDKEFFTPEKVIEIEEALGADIIMSFDECIPYPSDKKYARSSTERTCAGPSAVSPIIPAKTKPSLASFKGALSRFPRIRGQRIGQDGFPWLLDRRHLDRRAERGLPSDGRRCVRPLPTLDKPRYLMGVGSLDYILGGIERGVDMFDCVLPTRIARHGALMTSQGRVNIKGAQYKEDFTPLGSRMRLLHLHPLHQSLSAPSLHDQRRIWQAAQLDPQHPLPHQDDGRGARRRSKKTVSRPIKRKSSPSMATKEASNGYRII